MFKIISATKYSPMDVLDPKKDNIVMIIKIDICKSTIIIFL